MARMYTWALGVSMEELTSLGSPGIPDQKPLIGQGPAHVFNARERCLFYLFSVDEDYMLSLFSPFAEIQECPVQYPSLPFLVVPDL
jgi:hypothetical protein